MSAKFVVSHLEEQMGPFDESELKAHWLKGDLLPIDYVFDEAKQDWILLSERFPWAATGKAGGIAPPPLRDVRLGKKLPPQPPAAVKMANTGTRVKMVDGRGEVDLAPLEPGKIEVMMQESASGVLKLQSPLQIHVKAAEPAEIQWTLPREQTVGQDLEIHLRVVDQSDHLCAHYNDGLVIQISGSENRDIDVALKNGEARVQLPNTKAGSWKLSVYYSGDQKLKVPDDQTLEWLPGAACRLILDGPQEYVVGHPLKLQLKAVDSYGNLAKNFQGIVTLEIKAS